MVSPGSIVSSKAGIDALASTGVEAFESQKMVAVSAEKRDTTSDLHKTVSNPKPIIDLNGIFHYKPAILIHSGDPP